MTNMFIPLGNFAVLNCKDVSSVPLESVAAIHAIVLVLVGPFDTPSTYRFTILKLAERPY